MSTNKRTGKRWRKGSHWVVSDRSGFIFPAEEMVTEWTGAVVHKSEFEPKHPQLMIRGRKEKINADPPIRTEPAPDESQVPTRTTGGYTPTTPPTSFSGNEDI